MIVYLIDHTASNWWSVLYPVWQLQPICVQIQETLLRIG